MYRKKTWLLAGGLIILVAGLISRGLDMIDVSSASIGTVPDCRMPTATSQCQLYGIDLTAQESGTPRVKWLQGSVATSNIWHAVSFDK